MTPADPTRHGASVRIASPYARTIVDVLHTQDVYACNGNGRIRISFHGYNATADTERPAQALISQIRI